MTIFVILQSFLMPNNVFIWYAMFIPNANYIHKPMVL